MRILLLSLLFSASLFGADGMANGQSNQDSTLVDNSQPLPTFVNCGFGAGAVENGEATLLNANPAAGQAICQENNAQQERRTWKTAWNPVPVAEDKHSDYVKALNKAVTEFEGVALKTVGAYRADELSSLPILKEDDLAQITASKAVIGLLMLDPDVFADSDGDGIPEVLTVDGLANVKRIAEDGSMIDQFFTELIDPALWGWYATFYVSVSVTLDDYSTQIFITALILMMGMLTWELGVQKVEGSKEKKAQMKRVGVLGIVFIGFILPLSSNSIEIPQRYLPYKVQEQYGNSANLAAQERWHQVNFKIPLAFAFAQYAIAVGNEFADRANYEAGSTYLGYQRGQVITNLPEAANDYRKAAESLTQREKDNLYNYSFYQIICGAYYSDQMDADRHLIGRFKDENQRAAFFMQAGSHPGLKVNFGFDRVSPDFCYKLDAHIIQEEASIKKSAVLLKLDIIKTKENRVDPLYKINEENEVLIDRSANENEIVRYKLFQLHVLEAYKSGGWMTFPTAPIFHEMLEMMDDMGQIAQNQQVAADYSAIQTRDNLAGKAEAVFDKAAGNVIGYLYYTVMPGFDSLQNTIKEIIGFDGGDNSSGGGIIGMIKKFSFVSQFLNVLSGPLSFILSVALYDFMLDMSLVVALDTLPSIAITIFNIELLAFTVATFLTGAVALWHGGNADEVLKKWSLALLGLALTPIALVVSGYLFIIVGSLFIDLTNATQNLNIALIDAWNGVADARGADTIMSSMVGGAIRIAGAVIGNIFLIGLAFLMFLKFKKSVFQKIFTHHDYHSDLESDQSIRRGTPHSA